MVQKAENIKSKREMQAKASEEQTSQRKSPKETDEELRQIALH